MSRDEEDPLTPGDRELEAALAGLVPTRPRFTPEWIEARAILARERRRTRAWRAVAAALAVGLGGTIWTASTPAKPQIVERVVERVVYRDASPSAPNRWVLDPHPAQPSVTDEFAYLRMRQRILSKGVESLHSLPAATPARDTLPADAATRRDPPAQGLWPLDYLLPGGRS